MTLAEGALRQGVLWDLLGRVHHRDIREVTVDQFVRRYHVEQAQSQRVGALAREFHRQLDPVRDEKRAAAESFLDWAARLHEIGISIAQGAYHKHSAYILANADMPGFSRQEQAWLSNLVLAQRGRLLKMRAAFDDDPSLALLALCLRLAVIFYRSRRTLKLPRLRLARKSKGWQLEIDGDWLARNTLVAIALDAERGEWESVGLAFEAVEGPWSRRPRARESLRRRQRRRTLPTRGEPDAREDQGDSRQVEELDALAEEHPREQAPERRHEVDEDPRHVGADFRHGAIPEDVADERREDAHVEHGAERRRA